MNHPQINHLRIYGVELPPPVLSVNATLSPTFQHLITIDAHPHYIVWLMNSLGSRPNALLSLQKVVISSESYEDGPDFEYLLFHSALEAIAAFPRTIALAFTFNSHSHIEDWFHWHILAGNEKSVLSRLVHVETLSIQNTWFLKYTDTMIAMIPDWLKLFPTLKHFKFEGEAYMNVARLIEPRYVASVAVLCQKLKTMDVDRKTFDLGSVRRKLGILD